MISVTPVRAIGGAKVLIHRPGTILLLTAIVLLAFGLRLPQLGDQPVWWDESYSWFLAKMDLASMVQATSVDIHPPLYYWLLHFWVQVAGESEYALRFLSLGASVVTVALVVHFARKVHSTRLALVAGLLAVLSPIWVNYAQEARMYALETATTLLASLFFFRILAALQEDGISGVPRRWWLWYIFWAAVSLWLDYFPVFVFFFHNVFVLGWLWLAYPRDRGRFFVRWIGAQALVAIFYAPWMFVALPQVTGYGFGNVSAPSLQEQIVHLWRAFTVGMGSRDSSLLLGQTLAGTLETPLLVGLLVIALGGVILLALSGGFRRRGRLDLVPCLLLGHVLVPIAAFLAIISIRPFFHVRYILVATPALYLLLGLAVLAYGRWRRWLLVPTGAFAIGTLLVGYLSFQTNPEFAKDDARPALQFIATQLTGRDLVLWGTPHPFIYYYDLPAEETHFLAKWKTDPRQLAKVAYDKQRVFWVQWMVGGEDPWGVMPFLLEKHGRRVGQALFPGFRVTWFDLALDGDFSLGEFEPLAVSYGDAIRLEAAAFGGDGEKRSLPSGQAAWVSLRWQAMERPKEDLKFSIKVLDEQENVVAQSDKFLHNDRTVTARFWRPGDIVYSFATPEMAPGTPPGRYLVELSLYAQNIHSPEAQWQEVSPTGLRSRLILGTLEVLLPAMPTPKEAFSARWTTPSPAIFGPLELFGYDVKGATGDALPMLSRRAGDEVHAILFWHALQRPQQDRMFTLALVDEDGHAVHEARDASALRRFPVSQWRRAETLIDWRRLLLPPDIQEGTFRLELRGEDNERVTLARVVVEGRPRSFVEPPVDQRVDVHWGNFARLLGFSLDGDLRPGERVVVRLAWRATGATSTSYTVFLHLSDATERIWSQDDSPPLGGLGPTTSWLEGEVIEDSHELLLPQDIPSGDYTLYAGLYDPLTGQRVRTVEGKERIILSEVTVQ